MHSHVAQDTPDHHDQQLLATDTDGVLLRRRHPIKLAVVGLAMVTLLGAAGCGAASGQDDGSGGADDGSGGGSREPVTVVEKTVIVKEEARDAGQGSGGVGARGATQQDDQGDDRGTGQGHDQSDDQGKDQSDDRDAGQGDDQSDDQANDRSDNRDDEQGDDRDDNRGEDDLNDRGDDQGNDLDDDRNDSGDDLDD
jgi:hypothetical protein